MTTATPSRPRDPSPPTALFHYLRREHILDVVKNKHLRATPYGSLNDVTELMGIAAPREPHPRSPLGPLEPKNPTTGCVSFTEIYDSQPMWAYYAEAHRGVVLWFDTKVDGFLKGVERVRYSADEGLDKNWLLKDPTWAHEREWRCNCQLDRNRFVVRNGQGMHFASFGDSLAGIMFGARWSVADLQAFANEADDKWVGPPLMFCAYRKFPPCPYLLLHRVEPPRKPVRREWPGLRPWTEMPLIPWNDYF